MRNDTFRLLSPEEKKSKFRAILNTRTEGRLTEDELRIILQVHSPEKQYSIKVFNEKDAYTAVLQLPKGHRGRTLFGQVFSSYEDQPGELVSPSRSAAIIAFNPAEPTSIQQLLLYIPQERIQKGMA